MTLQDTGNFRRRLAAFLDPTNPNLDQIEPYPSVMGGEVKPPFVSTMPYLGGGSMEPIGPYIPSDDNRGIELFDIARANTANPHSTFIRDPGGSGKAIKFTYPLDLRGVDDKLGVFPFTQIKAQQGDSFRPAGMIFSA